MHQKRKFPNSQLITVKQMGGVQLTFYIVEDLNDEELLSHFRYYMAKEDFEYVAAIVAEAGRRGLKFTLDKT